MEEAKPGETWADIYKRTSARMRFEGGRQHPQIEGDQNRAVFGGEFPDRGKTVPVRYVASDGLTAKIDAGSLLGVTCGSIYKKFDPQKEDQELPTIEIITATPTWSKGRVKGELKAGDLVVLEHYQHDTEPMQLFVRGDLDSDQPLAEKIKSAAGMLPGYDIAESQRKSDFVIQILRPRKKDGKYIYHSKNDSLPLSFADQPPECWILTPDELLYQEKLKIQMADAEKGLSLLCENLEKITRVKNLTRLASEPGEISPVQLDITIWGRDGTKDSQEAETNGRLWPEKIEVGGNFWYQERTVTAKELEQFDMKADRLLTFSVHNTSDKSYFIYLINITSGGQIIPFYPPKHQSSEYGKVGGKETRKIEEVTLWIDQTGHEYIRLIASLKPLDIYVLEQEGYRIRSRKRELNPLEELLSVKAGYFSRGKLMGPIATAEWATVQGAFNVIP
jgi:hypothetical protein